MVDDAIRISPAVPGDATAFGSFLSSAWRMAGPDAPGFTGASDEVIADLASPETFAGSIEGPGREMFLAWLDDAVVGFVSTRHSRDTAAEITGLIVHPAHARRGIGNALVNRAIEALPPGAQGDVRVRTELHNHRAIGFYRRIGFEPIAESVEIVAGVAVEMCELVKGA